VTWPGGIAAVTLFVEDLEEARRFYREVFGLPVLHEDGATRAATSGRSLAEVGGGQPT
jgi:catechol 2,3-dioxygenase-like lactoylglutathione lyase family enzyme